MDTSSILHLSDIYCDAKCLSEARISTLIFNQGMRIKRVRNGGGLTVASYNKAIQYFSDHWPLDLDWPYDIPRPTPAADSLSATAAARARSPLSSLTEEGTIANPNAFCKALYVPRHTYDQAVRTYGLGGEKAGRLPRPRTNARLVVDTLTHVGDARFKFQLSRKPL